LTGWQRTHVLAAAEYLREILLRTPGDAKARAVYDGLLDLLEPARRVARQASDAPDGDPVEFELRAETDRRSGKDRRRANLGPPGAVERRQRERRSAERRRQ
jgi:hypothetical protein